MLDHNVHEGKRRPKESIKGRKEGREEERIIEGGRKDGTVLLLYYMNPYFQRCCTSIEFSLLKHLGILFKRSTIGTRGEDIDTGKKQDIFALEFRECQLAKYSNPDVAITMLWKQTKKYLFN